MQGFTLKSSITLLIFCFVTLTTTSLSAATTGFNGSAGCMGCHQGETSSITLDETATNDLNNQNQSSTKKKSVQITK